MRGDGGGDSCEAAKKPANPIRGKYFLSTVAGAPVGEQRKSVRANHPVKPHAESENEVEEEYCPPGRSLVTATAAVAATYVYFLIFAQFGLLQALTAVLGEGPAWVRPVMAVMGTAGIVGSVLMARIFKEGRGRGLMTGGFVVAGMAAGLAWGARSPGLFFVCAALTGLGTGLITVGLAGLLRRETGGGRLGWCIGIGTGLAYAFCNLPPVFAAPPRAQAVMGIGAVCVGLIAVQLFEQRAPGDPPSAAGYERRGVILWTLGLFALVAFDSAVFLRIQHTPGLKAETWTTGPQLLANAAAHLVAGGLVGLALDRRRVTGAALAAAGLILVATGLIFTGQGRLGAPVYAAAVSVYSAVLVFYPARRGAAGLAALIYAVAGWLGSAVGIVVGGN